MITSNETSIKPSMSTQLIVEAVHGAHNISTWVQEEIAGIDVEDIETALQRAELFLTRDRDDLDEEARIKEIMSSYGLEEAKQLIVDTLLEVIILIKPEIHVRAGKEVLFQGVSPIQAVGTQIGLRLHKNQIDAVETGIAILAEFEDLGIFEVRVVREADRAQNRGGHIEVHGDSAVVVPKLSVGIDLYHKINLTQYLPPMLVQPQDV